VRARFLDAARQLGREKQGTAQKELSTVYEPLAQKAGLDFGQLLPLELGQGATAPQSGGKVLSEQQIADTIAEGQTPGKTPVTRQQVIDWARDQGYQVPEK
jgi:hypothetical protein